MKRFNKLIDLYGAYEKELEIASEKIKPLCEFPAVITFCAGDGHLILNEDNAEVAFLSCLKDKTKKKQINSKTAFRFELLNTTN